MLIRAILVLLTLSLTACGFEHDPDSRDGAQLIEENVRIAGLPDTLGAKIFFVQPLKGINSREHFVVDAQFLEEGATLTLHSHFNGYKWRDGMQVRLQRQEHGLLVYISSPAFPPLTTTLKDGFLPNDFRIKLRIEIHDGVSATARVLIWRDSVSQQGEVERSRTFLSASNSDLDSAALGWTFLTHGRGAFWGLETQNVKVHSAFREAPYVP